MTRRRLWFFSALITGAMLTCSVIYLVFNSDTTQRASELQDAERRWALRPFGAYRIELEDLNCTQIVDVRNEKIVHVVPGRRCTSDARTITDLFTLIRRDGALGARCITQGCACDDHISVRASYNMQHGYPERIYVRIAPKPNWQHVDYWKYLVSHLHPPTCSYAAGDKVVAVRKLEALP